MSRLPPGRRGLKSWVQASPVRALSRLPPGRRGLKLQLPDHLIDGGQSPPTREAWIEMAGSRSARARGLVASHPGGVD